MQTQMMDREALQTWVLHKLGAPFLKIEIAQENLDYCLDEAMRWFSSKKGYKEDYLMPITPSIISYDLPDEIDTVLECTFSSTSTDYSYLVDPMNLIGGQIPTNMFGYGMHAGGDTGGFLSTYVQFTQYLTMARHILNSDLDWVQANRKLVVLPPPKNGGFVQIHYKKHSFTVEQLSERDHDLVKRKLLSLTKDFVGRVRSKYSAYPSAQGNAIIDGNALIQESQMESEKLEQEIFDSGFPMGFIHG